MNVRHVDQVVHSSFFDSNLLLVRSTCLKKLNMFNVFRHVERTKKIVRHVPLRNCSLTVAKNGNMSNGNIRHAEATFDMLLRHVAGVDRALCTRPVQLPLAIWFSNCLCSSCVQIVLSVSSINQCKSHTVLCCCLQTAIAVCYAVLHAVACSVSSFFSLGTYG